MKEKLKSIDVITPEQHEESIPTEEWYYMPFAKPKDSKNWQSFGGQGTWLNNKELAVEKLCESYLDDWEKKIIKVKLPI